MFSLLENKIRFRTTVWCVLYVHGWKALWMKYKIAQLEYYASKLCVNNSIDRGIPDQSNHISQAPQQMVYWCTVYAALVRILVRILPGSCDRILKDPATGCSRILQQDPWHFLWQGSAKCNQCGCTNIVALVIKMSLAPTKVDWTLLKCHHQTGNVTKVFPKFWAATYMYGAPQLVTATNMAANVTNTVACATKTVMAVVKLWKDFTQMSPLDGKCDPIVFLQILSPVQGIHWAMLLAYGCIWSLSFFQTLNQDSTAPYVLHPVCCGRSIIKYYFHMTKK